MCIQNAIEEKMNFLNGRISPPLYGILIFMKFFDSTYHFPIADSGEMPLADLQTSMEKINDSLSHYIISASGWRTVFAASGDEEDTRPEIKDEDKVIVTILAKAYYDHVAIPKAKILIGIDARPTGQIIADIFIRTLIRCGAEVDYLFIAAAPEIMAFSHAQYDGFVYISASHNPIGHNGFKFGRSGGVYERDEADTLASAFRAYMAEDPINTALALHAHPDQKAYESVLKKVDEKKREALAYYRDFVIQTAGIDKDFKAGIGIVAELNGSARGASIDKEFLTSLGVKVKAINDIPRQVVHAIVPEGENLELARQTLEQMHALDHSYSLGYTPDNDGDRGNFVATNKDGKAFILAAQEVFALVVAIELADQAMKGKKNLAVAVNGPTSERIDALASCFGAKVFRSEVGEANVVNLAAKLRKDGYTVHILGEGSNGGNITEPAKVRDPLNSIMTILKFFASPTLYAFMREKLQDLQGDASIENLLAALPCYTTTGAFSKSAKMKVKSQDYARLKDRYESLFLASWPEMQKKLADYGITRFTEFQTEGIVEKEGMGKEKRGAKATGGLKIVFENNTGEHLAYMWTRPSGTEPLLRILVDVKGKKEALHDALLHYQRSLIEQADCLLD